ncbi:glutamate ABC transporter substrate-binding protein [Miniimonas arenae]|uniref:Glutamate ABC transporter substrate-binding protein n=1 Tax=Miniimonas arenae TaxID=676201 RepID=A0A5C5BH57_9MICO|nr:MULTISPECIES: glutamate ABC transporter substrate-binding protein [Miniimonas]TNU76884.1 glutamate ABC transporter substrate-binding protein [Miniimonas arenae]
MSRTTFDRADRVRGRRAGRSRRALAGLAALALLAVTAACSGPDGQSDLGRTPEPTATASAEPTTAPTTAAPAECADPTQSYDPLATLPAAGAMPSGSTMAEIADRGQLIAGVSADTLLMGARNPFTGAIEGFDIDVVRDISTAIFGDPDHVQYRVITSGQRLQALQDGTVDVVARTFSVTCARWAEIAFSAVYFQAGQKLLVSADSPVQGFDDLAPDTRVCAPSGTTTLTRLEEYDVEAVPAATHTECLALFQQGQVDAITGDDTILAGFAAQDPYASVVGAAISAEPYGVGIAADDVDLVQFVNAVLAQRVADGRWQASYDRWLAPALGAGTGAPTPVYGRTP